MFKWIMKVYRVWKWYRYEYVPWYKRTHNEDGSVKQDKIQDEPFPPPPPPTNGF